MNLELFPPPKEKILLSIAALSAIKGIGFKTITGLYDRGILATIWDMRQQEIEKIAGDLTRKHCPQFADIVTDSKAMLLDRGKSECEKLAKRGISFVLQGYTDYPSSLLRLNIPPRWLFVMGNIEAIHSKGIIGIIGSREASYEGYRIAHVLAKEMVFRNLVVLSGLAKGIDSEAHRGAAEFYGRTIGILGHGFEATYGTANNHLWPEIVERDGAIVSEYYIYDAPSREAFLRRNEIQAALSNVIVPVECPDLSSGTGATIRRSIAIGTPIAGVSWETLNTATLLATRDNLLSLNIPVFALPEQSDVFWNFIRMATPEHEWGNINSQSRQDRFRRIHEDEIVEEMRRASFDTEAISKWTTILQKRINAQEENKGNKQ